MRIHIDLFTLQYSQFPSITNSYTISKHRQEDFEFLYQNRFIWKFVFFLIIKCSYFSSFPKRV